MYSSTFSLTLVLDRAGWWMPRPSSLPLDKTRFGRVQKILPPPEFDPWTVQPVASCYTNYTILPHFQMQVFVKLLPHPAQSLWLWFWNFEYILSIAEFCFWGGLALILMKGQVSSLHFIHITFDHFHVLSITVCVCIFQINWTPLCMLNTYWIVPLVNIPFSSVHLHCMFTLMQHFFFIC